MEPGRLVACSSCLSLSVHQNTKWTLKSSSEISTPGCTADAYALSIDRDFLFHGDCAGSPCSGYEISTRAHRENTCRVDLFPK
jgi:hypothetical protein